jgi:hypothetical protein
MRLSWLLSLPAVLSVTSALAIEKRDADFFSVRTSMHQDMSGKRGDPKGKYFRKSRLSRANNHHLHAQNHADGLCLDR